MDFKGERELIYFVPNPRKQLEVQVLKMMQVFNIHLYSQVLSWWD